MLRQFAKGYDSADGFDLRHIERIPQAKLDRVRQYAPILRQEIAEPFVKVTPRTKATLKAAQRHTRQTDIPGRKAFAVHVHPNKEAKSKVVFKGKKKKTLEIETTVRRTTFTERYFYLTDYGPAPQTFKEIIKLAEKMLPHMPNGYYTIETSSHGAIGGPAVPREFLLQTLRSDWAVYDVIGGDKTEKDNRGLAETIIGFRLISTREAGAAREYEVRKTNRIKMRRFRAARRAAERRRITQRLLKRMR